MPELVEVTRVLGAVLDELDSGELTSPRWYRDRLRAAHVALDMARPPTGGPGAGVGSDG